MPRLLCLLVLALQAPVPRSVPAPPQIPTSLMTMGPAATLTLQWVQYAPDLDTAQAYIYRVIVEGQPLPVVPVQLPAVGCEGPPGSSPTPVAFTCRATPPPLVKTPGHYRVSLTAAVAGGPPSLPSASAAYDVRYPASPPPALVVLK